MQTQIQSPWRPSDSTVLSSKLVRRLSKATRLLFSFRLSSQGDHLDCMRCSLLGSQPSCCQKRFCRPSVLVFRGRVGLFVGRSRRGEVHHSRKMFGPMIAEYGGSQNYQRPDLMMIFLTLNISNTITALAPTGTSIPICLVKLPNSSSQNSTTLPLQNSLKILGLLSNEQNIIVHLPFS